MLLRLLQKQAKPAALTDYRGITLCDTLSTWYMFTLMLGFHGWLAKSVAPAYKEEVMVYDYEPDISCDSLASALQFLLDRGCEWQALCLVYIVCSHILAAFYNVEL